MWKRRARLVARRVLGLDSLDWRLRLRRRLDGLHASRAALGVVARSVVVRLLVGLRVEDHRRGLHLGHLVLLQRGRGQGVSVRCESDAVGGGAKGDVENSPGL